MPALADITIKKADAVTNVTFNAVAPSAGDGFPAIWRSNAASSIMGHRPVLKILLKDNASKNGRVFQGSVEFPHTSTHPTSGAVIQYAKTPIRFEGTLPGNVPLAEVREAVHQAGNLFVAALVRQILEEQVSAT